MHELAGVLSDSMRVLAKCRLSDILPGWQLLSVGSREVTTKHELLGLPHRGGVVGQVWRPSKRQSEGE